MYLGVLLAFCLWGSGCFEILGGESDACSGTALHNSASLRKHCAKTSEIFQVSTSISTLLWWSHQTLGEIAAIDKCGSILLWNALELASFVLLGTALRGAIAGADAMGGTCCTASSTTVFSDTTGAVAGAGAGGFTSKIKNVQSKSACFLSNARNSEYLLSLINYQKKKTATSTICLCESPSPVLSLPKKQKREFQKTGLRRSKRRCRCRCKRESHLLKLWNCSTGISWNIMEYPSKTYIIPTTYHVVVASVGPTPARPWEGFPKMEPTPGALEKFSSAKELSQSWKRAQLSDFQLQRFWWNHDPKQRTSASLIGFLPSNTGCTDTSLQSCRALSPSESFLGLGKQLQLWLDVAGCFLVFNMTHGVSWSHASRLAYRHIFLESDPHIIPIMVASMGRCGCVEAQWGTEAATMDGLHNIACHWQDVSQANVSQGVGSKPWKQNLTSYVSTTPTRPVYKWDSFKMSQSRLQTSKKRCQVDCTAPGLCVSYEVNVRHVRLSILMWGHFHLIQFILLIWFGLLMYTRHQLLTFLISILRASFWFHNELLHLVCGTKYPTETLPSEWSLVQKSSKRQDSTQDSWKAVRRVVTFAQRKCGKCGNPQEFGTRPKSAQGLKFFEFKGESSKSDDEVYTWGLILSSWQHTLCFLLLNLTVTACTTNVS